MIVHRTCLADSEKFNAGHSTGLCVIIVYTFAYVHVSVYVCTCAYACMQWVCLFKHTTRRTDVSEGGGGDHTVRVLAGVQ